VSDDVRRWSDELARDPSSLAFLSLGETLRRQGQLDIAAKVAVRGLERHPHRADAHDLLARVVADQGDWQRAFDEWDAALRIQPRHVGALKGLGFVRYHEGRYEEAERYLADAVAYSEGGDPAVAAALAHVRGALGQAPRGAAVETPDARLVFLGVLGDGDQTALLLDASGMVLAGAYVDAAGRDAGQEVGAQLSGISDEASRAMRHLGLGDWTSLVFETEAANVALAPCHDALLVVAADRKVPLGFVRRLLDRALVRGRVWLAEGA
jgi:tetratricopeptide (TPR) repeat protein